MVRRRARASWVRRCGAVFSKKVVAVVAKQLCLEIVSVGVRFREVEAVNAVIEIVYAINAQLHILRLACLPVVIDVVKVRSALITRGNSDPPLRALEDKGPVRALTRCQCVSLVGEPLHALVFSIKVWARRVTPVQRQGHSVLARLPSVASCYRVVQPPFLRETPSS